MGVLHHIAERCTCASFEARLSLVSTADEIVVLNPEVDVDTDRGSVWKGCGHFGTSREWM